MKLFIKLFFALFMMNVFPHISYADEDCFQKLKESTQVSALDALLCMEKMQKQIDSSGNSNSTWQDSNFADQQVKKSRVEDFSGFEVGRKAIGYGEQMVVQSSNGKNFIKPNSDNSKISYTGVHGKSEFEFEVRGSFWHPGVPGYRFIKFAIITTDNSEYSFRMKIDNIMDHGHYAEINGSKTPIRRSKPFNWKEGNSKVNSIGISFEDDSAYLTVNSQTVGFTNIPSDHIIKNIEFRGLYPRDTIYSIYIEE